MRDTIFALASGVGRSGVAVVRVSGPRALESLSLLIGIQAEKVQPRYAHYGVFKDPVSRETIDSGLVIFFKGPNSFTGEDVVEYHIHGSQATISELQTVLSTIDGHRLAEPGEFTRRAFENGKMDLTEAEAIADLIDAQTALQKEQALSQMGGALRSLYESWAERLTKSLAHIEADIEFPDEDDAEGVGAAVQPILQTVLKEMREHLQDNRRGELLRNGVKVAIIGAPNAGKSSLMNALAQRDVAIVSDMAGTTRDVIEVQIDLGGYPVIIYDTAGLRPDEMGADGHDAIEMEGMRRAMKIAEGADIKILLFDGQAESPDAHTLSFLDENALVVLNKSDLHQRMEFAGAYVRSSLKASDGLSTLMSALQDMVRDKVGNLQGAPSLTRDRHRRHVSDAVCALERSSQAPLPELMAEDVRLSVRDLGRITGKVDVEDLLDIVFKDFCIGK